MAKARDIRNALARWCVEKIHGERYGETITAEDMREAKEKIIRERGTHLDSLMERMKEPRVRGEVRRLGREAPPRGRRARRENAPRLLLLMMN